jgi:Mn2+/Fe2+ NRAMP family transporter
MMQIALGIVTAIGGFIDVGAIATTALAGALFGFQLVWAVVVATASVILLTEMCGRLAAVSHHTVADAIRERLGFPYFAVPLFTEVIVDTLVLAAEIGGIAVAVHLLTGYDYRWFVIPVMLLVWALLWYGNFSLIENGVSFLGLVALAFVAGAFVVPTPWKDVARGALPSLPSHGAAHYWFIAISIVGSVLQPFLLNFYSSGAVEENWTVKSLTQNKIVAGLGMSFGGIIGIGILVLGAMVLGSRGIHADSFEQTALTLIAPFGKWGLWLFAAALGIACLGAALDVALNLAYAVSQGFGWNWSENLKPHEDARFAAVYTAVVPIAALVVLAVGDPLKLTMLSMALNAVIAPLIVFPLLILMNDKAYLKRYRNSVVGNVLVSCVILLAFAVAVVAIPLEVFGA